MFNINNVIFVSGNTRTLKKYIKTNFSETDIRRFIREEVTAVLNNEPGLIAGSEDEGFLNTDQAAEYIKLKKTTLYNLINQNKIPFHKSGKRVLFKKSELSDWIKK